MNKPTLMAASFVIYNEDHSRFLIVQRPSEDEDLPDVWGLPAGTLREGETLEDVVVRSGRDKLGVGVAVGKEIGSGTKEREKILLEMHDFEASITQGTPSVPQSIDDVTQYQDLAWGVADNLFDAARKGSMCSRVFLDSMSIDWKK